MENAFQWKKGASCLFSANLIFYLVRCDQFPNCDDFSDEENCKLVVIPENYVTDYAPFTVDMDGNLVKVQVKIKVKRLCKQLNDNNTLELIYVIKIDLISILEINEVGQKFKTQFKLYIMWFDFRLKYYNMKLNVNLNTLTQDEKGSIWVPVMVFRKVFNIEEIFLYKNV